MRFTKFAVVAMAAALVLGCHGKKADGGGEAEIPLDQVPAAVSAGAMRDFPGATLKEADKETYPDGTVHYELELLTKDGKTQKVEYDTAGQQVKD